RDRPTSAREGGTGRTSGAYFFRERMYWMTAQRSASGRCLHGGIAPRPLEIFQNSSPSVSSCMRLDVQSAGLGVSAAAAAPSPLPPFPWQDAQLTSAIFFPFSTDSLPGLSGLFWAFSDSGAVHGACATARALVDSRATTARATMRCGPRPIIRGPPCSPGRNRCPRREGAHDAVAIRHRRDFDGQEARVDGGPETGVLSCRLVP